MTACFSDRVRSVFSRAGQEASPEPLACLDGGVASSAELEALLPALDGDVQVAACWVLGRLGGRRAIPALLRCARAGEMEWASRSEALRSIGLLGGPRARRGLFAFLATETDAQRRADAVHALYLMGDEEALPGLYAILQDPDEAPEVRGQAAEAIGSTLACVDRRRREYRRALGLLLASLEDEAPELRFWCAFALASMNAKEAITALERVAQTDRGICPGWWAVKDEAADAAALLRGGEPPERTRRPV